MFNMIAVLVMAIALLGTTITLGVQETINNRNKENKK